MTLAPLEATAAQREKFSTRREARARRKHPEFLLIDDQRFSLQLMQTALADQYTLHTALSAREGFDSYLEHAPDILWLDIEMPEFNGHQLTKAINAIDPDAYIVMVTANHYTDEGGQAKRNKVKGFITKPYSKQKVRDCIEKFMLERAPSKQI